jgi:hypothetical protein
MFAAFGIKPVAPTMPFKLTFSEPTVGGVVILGVHVPWLLPGFVNDR